MQGAVEGFFRSDVRPRHFGSADRFARMVDKNIYIIQGEINIVVGAIKRNARWSTHTPLDEERDPLLHSFSHLKEVLNNIT
ncbi:Hypothetical predicted protein, partial [Marmota monax]